MNTDAVANLSDMQLACLRLVADLKKTEQIAAELGISPSTVNTHIERAIMRLQVPNRREAARLVVVHDRAQTTALAAGETRPGIAAETRPTYPSSSIPPCPEKLPTDDLPLSEASIVTSFLSPSTTALGRRRNDLTITHRLLFGLLALFLICVGLGGLGSAIGKLSEWRASHGARR